MRATDGSRSGGKMFQIDPPTDSLIERAREVLVPGRTLSRSEVIRHWGALWAATTDAKLSPPPSPRPVTTHVITDVTPRSFALSTSVPAPETDGARLRRLRKAAGLTQAQLADAVTAASATDGASESQVRRFEGGARIDEDVAVRLRGWMRGREGGAG